MALAANKNRTYEIGMQNSLPVLTETEIFLGAAVGLSAGYARPLVAGDKFGGFAEQHIINKAANNPVVGASGALNVPVIPRGHIQLAVTGAADVTCVGSVVYAAGDDTFTTTQSVNTPIGVIRRFVSNGIAVVDFDINFQSSQQSIGGSSYALAVVAEGGVPTLQITQLAGLMLAALLSLFLFGSAPAVQAQPYRSVMYNTNAVVVTPTNNVLSFTNNITVSNTLTAGILSAPTNTANGTTVTNDLPANAWTLLRGQRSVVSISLANSTSTTVGGLLYSNASTGKIHVKQIGPTGTNTVTVFAEPNSMVAPTNCTVVGFTTDIDYQ